ncbi:MAG: glycosyltransferase family 2 protein [Lachnospiraceae bacterium]|nr:glycosyltransferase family 2 protein [Lachnospiraceae bacterium]
MNNQKEFDDNRMVSDVVNRLLGCEGTKELSVYGNLDCIDNVFFPSIRIHKVDNLFKCVSRFCLVIVDDSLDFNDFVRFMGCGNHTIILFVENNLHSAHQYADLLNDVTLKQSIADAMLYVIDDKLSFQTPYVKSDSFRVLAILHFYNEEDVIGQTIDYLLDQGLYVYLVDNWSTDNSYCIAEKKRNDNPQKVFLERFPDEPSDNYIWYDQLQKTEELSKCLDFDWFIHYDADEVRMSPWRGVTLRDAIEYIDSLGYNCIENVVIDFRITDKDDHIFGNGKYFEFRHKDKLIDQLKTWKKSEFIDLKSSGGHHAKITSPHIFPLKFLNRHYPLRSLEQAYKKVFINRLPRFKVERALRGWHGHYDSYKELEDFIFDKNELLIWDDTSIYEWNLSLFTESGIAKYSSKRNWDIPALENKKIILYGSGKAGRYSYLKLVRKNEIVLWVDKQFDVLPYIFCEKINEPKCIESMDFDFIVLAVISEKAIKEILEMMKQLSIDMDKILLVHDA